MPQIAVAAAAWIGSTVLTVTGSATLAAAAANTVAALGFAQGVGAAAAAWSTVASVAALARGKPRIGGAGGTQVDFKADTKAGIPYAIGQTGTGGNIVYATTAENKNQHLLYLTVLSLGPIEQVTAFRVNGNVVPFTGTNPSVGSLYHNKMARLDQLGSLTPSVFFPPATTALPEWDATHKLTGLAASWWVLEYDAKAYPTGTPKPLWELKGVKVYDPRLDTTYPGGAGPHRSNDESTWTWSENPFLHALAWALGRYQNGKRVMGLGAAVASINVAAFVEGANVADANGWKIGGIVYSTDSKYDVFDAMLRAGGGWPVNLGAQLSCGVNTPRVSLATLTKDDAAGEPSVGAYQPRRDRFNAAIPNYRSADHGYEIVPAAKIRVAAYVTADGKERSRELHFPLVPAANQAAQLARYAIEDSREFAPVVIPCKPRWMGYRPGDCITLNEPEWGLGNQKALILKRDRDPSSGVVTLTLRSETDGKHPFALGQTGTAPPDPALSGYDASAPAAPGVGAFTLNGATLTDNGVSIPIIYVAGSVDDFHAAQIAVRYRKNGTLVWAYWPPAEATSTRIEITGVTPQTIYEAEVAYVSVRGVVSAWTPLGTATAGVYAFTPPTSPNRLRFTGFEGGAAVGWETASNPSGLTIVDNSTPDPPGLLGYAIRISTITFTAGAQTVGIRSDDAYAFAVQGSERLSVQERVLTAGPCTAETFVRWLDASGALLSSSSAFTIGANVAFGTLKTGFVTAPANAKKAYLETVVTSTGAGTGFWEFMQPMVTGATATQTDHPAYVAGQSSEPGADVTALHTSADTAAGLGTNAIQDALFNLTASASGPTWQERTVTPALALTYAAGTSGGVRTLQALRAGSADGTTRTVNLGGALAEAVACLPTDRIEASVYIQTNDVDLVTLFVRCWDVSGSFLGDVQVAQRVGGNAGTFSAGTAQRLGGIVPPLANTRRVALLTQSRFFAGGANSNVNIAKPYLGKASAGQTGLTAWVPGIESQPGADVTGQNTSADTARGLGANLLQYASMPLDTRGWQVFPQLTGLTAVVGHNLAGFFGQNNVNYGSLSGGTPSAGAVYQLAATVYVPLAGGERIEASGYVALDGLTSATVQVAFYQANASGGVGTFITQTQCGVSGGAGKTAANGLLTNFDRLGGLADAPANARWALFLIQGVCTGGVVPKIFLTQPYLGKASAGQTALTPWNPGVEAQPGADVTNQNTSQDTSNVNGVPSTTITTGIAPLIDTTPPAAPTGLAASAAFQTVFLSWTNPADADLQKIEVWEHTADVRASATLIATVSAKGGVADAFARSGLASGVTRYYWVRGVDLAGNVGAFNGTAGVAVTTASLALPDFPATLRPVGRGNSLPSPVSSYDGDTFYLTTDQKLYRKNASNTAWIATTATTDLSGQVTTSQITVGAITTALIAAGAITTTELAAGAVTAAKIAAATITADRMNVSALSAIAANIGTVTAGLLQDSSGNNFLDLTNARQQFKVGSYVFRQGALGSGVLAWVGPAATAIGSETRTNGKFAWGDDGKVYYGTAELVDGSGAAGLTASASPTGVDWSGFGASPHTTTSTAVTPSGGSSYSYFWRHLTGHGDLPGQTKFICNNPNGSSTDWTFTPALGNSYAAWWECLVTDVSGMSVSVPVYVEFHELT